MRQIFNKKQLVVMWVVGIAVCFFLVYTSVEHHWQYPQFGSGSGWHWHVDWDRASLYPIVIMGALLVVTFAKRQPPKERRE